MPNLKIQPTFDFGEDLETTLPTSIGFSGHRNATCLESALEDILAKFPGCLWIHGGAVGFDSQVDAFAKAHGFEPLVLRPDYERYWGHVAPLIRNDEIVRRADVMVLCWDGRQNGGTWYSLVSAKRKGVPVEFVEPIFGIPKLEDFLR